MFLNLLIFLLEFSFLAVPSLVMPAPEQQKDVNDTCKFGTHNNYAAGQITDPILDFVTGQVRICGFLFKQSIVYNLLNCRSESDLCSCEVT